LRVLKRDYVYSSLDPEIVRRMGIALHDHAATLEHNLDESRPSAPRFEGIADNISMSPKALGAFQKLVEERGSTFLEEVDGWLAQNETDQTTDANTHTVRMGVGVYFIYDKTEEGQVQ
jgi:hypothetical protein